MGTVIGIRLEDGVALAADRRATDGSTVRSDRLEKLFGFDAAGAVAAGSASAIQEFGRQLEDEIRQLRSRQNRDEGPRIDALERLAGEAASESGAEAIVAARDGEGVASLRAIGSDGAAVEDPVLAQGTGAQVALGQLEDIDRGSDIGDAADLLEDVFETVSERDAETGDEIDVWTLADE